MNSDSRDNLLEDIKQQIHRSVEPAKMSSREAIDFLEELQAEIEASLTALHEENPEEDDNG